MATSGWTLTDAPRLDGRTAVVTGANSGIGLETARGLASRGARVVMACRNLDTAEQAREDILADDRSAKVEIVGLDLGSLDSVRAAAAEISDRIEVLDILVNNAGVMRAERDLTPEGFEMDFGTNFLGHHALTGLLFDRLSQVDGRVVTVGSKVHRAGQVDFSDLRMDRTFSAPAAYSRAKLAQMVWAVELQRRLVRRPGRAMSLMAHPGATRTGVMRDQNRFLVWAFTSPKMRRVLEPIVQDADRGALPTLRAATDPGALGGQYYGPGNPMGFTGSPVLVAPSGRANDAALAARLWDLAEESTGVKFDFS